MAKTGTDKAKTQSGRKKPKKPKPLTVGKAKDRAWRAFSTYIKLRDAIATTGTITHCKCITCGNVLTISYQADGAYIQSGHAIDGRAKNILFDECLTNGQCSFCNCVHNGRLPEYASIMIKKYGQLWWDERLKIARLPADKPWRVIDLLEIEETYKQKAIELIK